MEGCKRGASRTLGKTSAWLTGKTSFNYRLGPYKWYIPLFGFQISQEKNETEMESIINCCLPLVCLGFEPNDLQSRS